MSRRRACHGVALSALALLVTGCLSAYESRQGGQWDAREQIGKSEGSQVKLRAAQ